jgi:Leucine-rich repeat (LRR) protein
LAARRILSGNKPNSKTLFLADSDLIEISSQLGRLKNLRMLDLGHTS